jgi:hypothetical protein
MTTTVWTLPCKSQEFREGPRVRQGPSTMVLAYDFEGDTGEYAWEELTFLGVVAFEFTAARYCTAEQVGAYDRLEMLSGSSWSERLTNASEDLVHYRTLFDDVGCYEVLAGSFVPPAGRD